MQRMLGNLFVDLSLNTIGFAYFKGGISPFIIFYWRWVPMGLNILGKVLINKGD